MDRSKSLQQGKSLVIGQDGNRNKSQELESERGGSESLDAVIVGAGFAGLYMLCRLRTLGFSVRIYEEAESVGGTWFWNRYPGARCDVKSMEYSYSFSDELQQEWQWTERYASQPEILRYLNYVADRFELRRDIQLNTRVTAASFDESATRWIIRTDHGNRVTARFCIMATGCLSTPKDPDIKGVDSFQGNLYVREHRFVNIEANVDAENAWVEHVNELSGSTLFPLANSWYLGANIPGKPRVFIPYIGGVGVYRQKCADVAANGCDGFAFLSDAGAASRALKRA